MSEFLLLAFIFLFAGIVAVPIASRLGLGSVLGYLLAGIAISPILAWLDVDIIAIQHFAEFGVVMMLFLVGLELEPRRLWDLRGRLLGLGGGQVVGTAALIMAGCMAFDVRWNYALAIGLILALSSTAIVLQTLKEKGLMNSDGGQASFSVLLFQDIAVIPMLAFLPLLAAPELVEAASHTVGHSGDHSAGADGHGMDLSLVAGLEPWQSILVTVGAVAAVIVGGSYLTRPIFRFVAAAQLRELFTAVALILVVGIALLMTLVGLSPALGTFLAGVVLANSEYRHELEADIDPFRGLLLGLFFITVGAGINFPLLMGNLGLIVGATLGLIALKFLVLSILGRLFSIKGGPGWLFSLSLAQAGEFGFVLLTFSVANGVLPPAMADQLLLIVALSMLLTPLLFIAYERVAAPMTTRRHEREADAIDQRNHVIIAGRGRMGGIIDRILNSGGIQSTVIDYNSRHLDIIRKFGLHAYFGDATRPDLLHAAGIEDAKLLIVAIDDKTQISELVSYVLANHPKVHVVARAVDRDHVYELWARGCRDIIRETYDSSLRMGRSAFEALGLSREQASEIVTAFDEMDRKLMVGAADAYDISIPLHENAAYIEKVVTMRDRWELELRQRVSEIMGKER